MVQQNVSHRRDVSDVEARGNRVMLHAAGDRFLVRASMAALGRRLRPQGFLRVHRSWLIRSEAIATLEPLEGGDALLVLRDGAEAGMSRTYAEAVYRRLSDAAEGRRGARVRGRAARPARERLLHARVRVTS